MAEIDFRPGDCLDLFPTLADASIDAVITDPPYPEVNREYGRMTESEWGAMMRRVVAECRRVLKPHGSAVFVLQPNSERVGRMRAWLWEFLAWTARDWNQVQDVYWWNTSTPPNVHSQKRHGLTRPSVKLFVWLGPEDCYRNQADVMLEPSDAMNALKWENRLRVYPSGQNMRRGNMIDAMKRQNGVTPFNLLPVANVNSVDSAGTHGHGAGTPAPVVSWWVRYLTRAGDTVLDPFAGSGTVPLVARQLGRNAVAFERFPEYQRVISERIAGPPLPLFDMLESPPGGFDGATAAPTPAGWFDE